MIKRIFTALIVLSFISCSKSDIKIKEFKPISNIPLNESGFVFLPMDLNSVIKEGITIPSEAQAKEGFIFKAEVKNKTNERLYYKLFYQNSSYKFNEALNSGLYDTLSSENFYGSWIEDITLFKQVQGTVIIDSFRICGNPLNEKRFFGVSRERKEITEERIQKMIDNIKNDKVWFKNVKEKTKKNGSNLDMQLRNDAVWAIENAAGNKSKMENHRWKRNPRVGTYEFILVVLTESALKGLPDYIRDIRKKSINGFRVNPFYYFLHSEDRNEEGIAVAYKEEALKTKASLNLSKGMYVNYSDLVRYNISDSLFSSNCNTSNSLNKEAHIKQFFSHKELQGFKLNNIPVIADVLNDPYTIKDYKQNKEIGDDKRIKKFIRESGYACKTAYYNKEKDGVVLVNPGSDSSYIKESVGIASRIGFIYGKFTGKIKFTELLNEENLWNGMTNAFWLIYQGGDWNYRRIVDHGYVESYSNGEEKLVKKTGYSEIDIEIVKASRNWPKTSYSSESAKYDSSYNAEESEDIIIACTNWDLACQDVESFIKGAVNFKANNRKFVLHRWDDWYKAITSKYAHSEDDIFKRDFYFFQIDWQPDKIIWRIGPSKDSLFTICQMTDEVTNVPNNQMLTVVTQEWHYDKFWPTAPFSQDNIPFPKNDLEGVVYDIEIE